MNKLAPGGPAQDAGPGEGVKSAVVKPNESAKVSAKSRGEDAAKIDVLTATPGPGGITTVLTIANAGDGLTYRMCTWFSNDAGEIVVKPISQGTGRKLTAKNGVPVACPE